MLTFQWGPGEPGKSSRASQAAPAPVGRVGLTEVSFRGFSAPHAEPRGSALLVALLVGRALPLGAGTAGTVPRARSTPQTDRAAPQCHASRPCGTG